MTGSTGSPASADLDLGTITRAVRVAAPRELVWEALTSPDHVARWWGHPMRFPDGVRPGSVGVFEWSGGDFQVRVDRLERPSRYQLTWGFGPGLDEATATQVLFELADDGAGGTTVTVTETGFDRQQDLAARRRAVEENTDGWNRVLDWLASYAGELAR